MNNVLEKLPDPDQVGQSEYRLAYEFAHDLLEQGEDPLVVQAAMDELARSARQILIEITRKTNTF